MRKILTYFTASRLLFLLFALLAPLFIPLREGYLGNQFDKTAPYFAWIWANFDGRHYLNIATQGYRDFDFAFFPLYPLVIWTIKSILRIPPLYIGILVSLVSLFIAMKVVYKTIRIDFDEKTAVLSLFFLSIFPLSFFYHAAYGDSLFLLLSTASFYFARKGKWFLSGVFGLLSVLARLAGIALIPALAVEWWLQNRKTKDLSALFRKFTKTGFIAVFMAGLGILLYMLYLKVYFGDWLLFQKSMVAWRQNEFTFPPQVIFRYLRIFFLVDKGLLVYWVAVAEFLSMITYFALSFYVARRVRLSYGVLIFFILILPTFTGTFAGMPRYLLHSFPAFLGIALFLKDKKGMQIIFSLLLLALGFIFTALFTRGYWIA